MAGVTQRIDIRDDLVNVLKMVNGSGKYNYMMRMVTTEETDYVKCLARGRLPACYLEMQDGVIEDNGGTHVVHVQPFDLFGVMYVGKADDPAALMDQFVRDCLIAIMANPNRSNLATTTKMDGPPSVDNQSTDQRRSFVQSFNVRYLMPRNTI